MINIQKTGNAIVIDFTDNDKYLNNGTIEVAPNELMVVIDESNMATFKKMSNGDTLFGQLIDQIQIQGENVTKDNIIEKFGIIGFSAGGGGGEAGAVSSVNGQIGDVVITATSLGAITKANADAAYASKTELEEKQDTLVSGTNIKTINGQSVIGSGNIEIQGGELPIATADTLGGIKVGAGLSINPDTGVLSTTGGGTADSVEWDNVLSKPDDIVNITERLAAKLDTATYNSEKANFALKSELPDTSTLATKSEVTSGLATKLDVATYNVDKPTFALKTEIPDISGLATKTELSGKLDTATYNSEKASFETKENAAATYQVKGDYATTAQLNSKQDTLVSGTNIKTINGNSLLGAGDITIQAGGTVDTAMSDTSTNAVQNKVIKKYIDDLVGNILTQLQEINGTN